jgi:dihydrofolate reductase
MIVSILVAVAKNGVIGKDNQLIWRLSEDLKNFKKLTLGHSIIMGRKTFDSIGKPLPGRTSIVISRNKDLVIPGCEVAGSLTKAIETAAENEGSDEVFVIGGGEIFKQAQELADKIYLTIVDAEPEGDAFFDRSPYNNWEEISRKVFKSDDKNQYDFEIIELQKN